MPTVKIKESCFIGGKPHKVGSEVKLNDKDAKTLVAMGRAQIVKKEAKSAQPVANTTASKGSEQSGAGDTSAAGNESSPAQNQGNG